MFSLKNSYFLASNDEDDGSEDENMGDVTSSSLEGSRDHGDEGYLAALMEKPKPKHTWHAVKALIQQYLSNYSYQKRWELHYSI